MDGGGGGGRPPLEATVARLSDVVRALADNLAAVNDALER